MSMSHEQLAWLRAAIAARATQRDEGDGILLFSGGLDSAAVGILARRRGLDLTPAYMSHRGNVGNVTKKELVAARRLARQITGRELVVFKPQTKRTADFYGPDVRFSSRLPVVKAKKPWRNRIMLDVLADHGLASKQTWVGVFGDLGMGPRARAAGRGPDVSQEGLQAHLHRRRGLDHELRLKGPATVHTGDELTPRGTVGELAHKTALVKAVSSVAADLKLLHQTESCLMWWGKHCGNCWSCVDRANAFMAATGADPTRYKRGTTAYRRAHP